MLTNVMCSSFYPQTNSDYGALLDTPCLKFTPMVFTTFAGGLTLFVDDDVSSAIYLTILQWFAILQLASNYKYSKFLARLQLDYDGKILERSAIIIQRNMVIGNSAEFEDFTGFSFVRYDIKSEAERQKRVEIDKFIKFEKNPVERQHPFVLVTTKQNMKLDPRAVTTLPITSKEANDAKSCIVIVSDRPHRVQIIDLQTCMEVLPELQEGFICIQYAEASYKGFALICDNELSGIILPRSTWSVNEPILYTDIYKRRDWILEQMNGHREPAETINEVVPLIRPDVNSIAEDEDQQEFERNPVEKTAEHAKPRHDFKCNM
uniref:Uncharacterized protein n=1 Tax=Glossina brevipalpis TaxID=37001 RepID=A0A1A9W0B0_9MUSC